MNLWAWLIVLIPLAAVLYMAFFSRRYVRDVADYLVAGRVAGRYVISVADLTSGLSVITLVAWCEQNYQTGIAMNFWGQLVLPLSIFISLSGYCVYRFRQSRCLSMGQFLELRYSRRFRIVAATLRTLAEMVTNAIGPAVAVRFFIYFLGLPHKFDFGGVSISTYTIMVMILLAMALAIIWPAGRISLLITDCFQGIISYPIFVIFTVFILTSVSWSGDVTPVMLDRAAGESFLNPMDVQELRDFNIFALIVNIVATILNRAAWFGNDTTSTGRTPHEQKMADILGTWRNGFSWTMMTLLGLFIITVMLSDRFALPAHGIRVQLADKVAEEVFYGKNELRAQIHQNVSDLPVPRHVIGRDQPYSRISNPDVAVMDTTLNTMQKAGERDMAKFQEFRSLYNQMMMPVMLRNLLPPVMIGLFVLLMIMLLLSTDDSRIFNASSTIIQDIVLPLRKTPFSMDQHLSLLKTCSLGVTLFFFVMSFFFAQLDFINMFITIMCAIWLGAAGPIMVGGLYTRLGTTSGAWCALIFGSGFALAGLILQRSWAGHIYPWLEQQNYAQTVGNLLEVLSSPFHPYVVWQMNATKFPINSMEIYFLSMILGSAAYVTGSLLSYRGPYNLDKLFHRGIYSDGESLPEEKFVWSFDNLMTKLVGITEEYSKGDRIIAWSVFFWSIIYCFGILFCGVLIWNAVSPWPVQYWSNYFFFTTVLSALIVGTVSTVWFMIGGIRDTLALFRDLAKRMTNPLDDGRVEDGASLADKAHFDQIEHLHTQDNVTKAGIQ